MAKKKKDTMIYEPVCYSCKYYLGPYDGKQICEAFMFGIPSEIWSDGDVHDKVKEGQTKDLTYKVNSYG